MPKLVLAGAKHYWLICNHSSMYCPSDILVFRGSMAVHDRSKWQCIFYFTKVPQPNIAYCDACSRSGNLDKWWSNLHKDL